MPRPTGSHAGANKFPNSTRSSTTSNRDSRTASYDEKVRTESTRAKEQLKSWTQDVREFAMKLPSRLGKDGRQERKALEIAVDGLDSLLMCLRRFREDQVGLFMQAGENLLEKIQSRSSKEKREMATPEPDEVLKVLKGFQDEIDTMIGRVEKVKEDAKTMKKSSHTKDLQKMEERAEVEYLDGVKLLNKIQASKEFKDCYMKVYNPTDRERVGKGAQD